MTSPLQISTHTLPAGVIASTSAYDQGRLPSIYPRPDEWLPSRWLEAPTEAMHLNWTPFGHGARSCPGANLAMTELKYMIGTVVRLFRVLPPRRHEVRGLELGDVFVCAERSGRCWLRFEEMGDGDGDGGS